MKWSNLHNNGLVAAGIEDKASTTAVNALNIQEKKKNNAEAKMSLVKVT